MYKLVFEKRAADFLSKLDDQIKERVWRKLQECKQDPFRHLEHLTEINGYKLRVGDYRIIIEVDKKIETLFILKIGHRKNVYD